MLQVKNEYIQPVDLETAKSTGLLDLAIACRNRGGMTTVREVLMYAAMTDIDCRNSGGFVVAAGYDNRLYYYPSNMVVPRGLRVEHLYELTKNGWIRKEPVNRRLSINTDGFLRSAHMAEV